ncbi:MAG: transglycosylase domain-containing protein [Clostridia bacterium]|nr:transglycosylase domain-containing protein [Clostridia bacterium]
MKSSFFHTIKSFLSRAFKAWKARRAKKRQHPKFAERRRRGWFIFGTVVMILLMTAALCATAFAVYVQTSIDVDFDSSFNSIKLDYTTTVYYTDADGNTKEYAKLHGTQNREWVAYDDIPEDLRKAIVAIEDERFWDHKGVDWKRTIGAFVQLALTWDSSYGGSTITQQLIKNITEYDDVTIKRKVTEILRALKVEKELSKQQILEYYLNTINLGHGCYGVASAAKTYFGKDVSELTLEECASIAGITNLPYYYDPLNYPEHNIKRQKDILWKMHQLKIIDDETYEKAKNTELVFAKETLDDDVDDGINSYFTDMLMEDLIADLMEEKGYSRSIATQLIYRGGLSIYATVDPKVQKVMEDVFENDANWQILNTSIQPQSAMIVYDTEGNVKGVVGGRGVKLENRGLNRATMSKRQPGSSIKPITVYAPAVEYGLITPYSVYDDSPMFYIRNGSFVDETGLDLTIEPEEEGAEPVVLKKKVWPENYYTPYRGMITIMEAVEDSTNTVAVRVLQDLTLEKSFEFASEKMGLESLVEEKTNKTGNVYTDIGYPQLALGGLTDGITLRELTAAYVTFTNDGLYTKPRSYTHVIDANGETILNNIPEMETVLSEKAVYYMNTLLSRVVSHGTDTAARISKMATAGKTGSTNDNKDRWFIGYTPYYVAGCWYGYDKPQVISGASGNPALKAWKLVMDKIHEGLEPVGEFATTLPIVEAEYCTCSGGIPSTACLADLRGTRSAIGKFVAGDEPVEVCPLHILAAFDPISKTLATTACPGTKDVGFLNLNRYYTVSGVTIRDEQYTLRAGGLPTTDIEGLVYYYPTPVLNSGQTVPYNRYCTTH